MLNLRHQFEIKERRRMITNVVLTEKSSAFCFAHDRKGALREYCFDHPASMIEGPRVISGGGRSMSLKVIGAGVGRTGTMSLRLAIDQLGLGPCYHMEVVLQNMPTQVPLWVAALKGRPDWAKIYDGFGSAVDWPTAAFFRELIKAYPSAKFVLTHRDPGNWADSFGSTIRKLVDERNDTPPPMKVWLDMVEDLLVKTGFPQGLDRDGLIKAFTAHNDAVKEAIPAGQLLVYQVKEGWGPLCEFLGVPVPKEDFPRTNAREEFWDLVNAARTGG